MQDAVGFPWWNPVALPSPTTLGLVIDKQVTTNLLLYYQPKSCWAWKGVREQHMH